MNVYVLTTGSYSERELVGIFSTRELADQAVTERSDDDDNNVEEVTLDACVGWKRCHRYVAAVRLSDGKAETYATAGRYYSHPTEAKITVNYRQMFDERVGHEDAVNVISPISIEHALEVANETRQIILAAAAVGEGGTVNVYVLMCGLGDNEIVAIYGTREKAEAEKARLSLMNPRLNYHVHTYILGRPGEVDA